MIDRERSRAERTRSRSEGARIGLFAQRLYQLGIYPGTPAQMQAPPQVYDSLQNYVALLFYEGYSIPSALLEEFGVDEQEARALARLVKRLNTAALSDPTLGEQAAEAVQSIESRFRSFLGGVSEFPTPEGAALPAGFPTPTQPHSLDTFVREPFNVLFGTSSLTDAISLARENGVSDDLIEEGLNPSPAKEPGVPDMPGQGRIAPAVIIETEDGLQLGVGSVFGIGETGRLVVVIPTESWDEINERLGTDYEQGDEIEIKFGNLVTNLDGSRSIDPDKAVKDGPLTAVVLASDDMDELTPLAVEALRQERHVVDEELQAALDALGAQYSSPESALDDILGQAIALFEGLSEDQITYLGLRQTPLRILYKDDPHRGKGAERVRILGEKEEPPLQRDPVSFVNLAGYGRVEDIEPHFTGDMVMTMLSRLTPAEFALFKEEAIRNGLLHQSAAHAGMFNTDVMMAMEMAMAHSNETGIYDQIQVTDEKQAIFLALNSWGVNGRKPVPDYEPPRPRVMPSNEEMAFTVADYFQQRTGRKPTPWEMKDLVDYLAQQYRVAMDQAEMYAEREYLLNMQEGEEGMANQWYLTAAQQRRLQQPLPREIFQTNPAAAFQMYFEENYKPAVQAAEAQQTAVDFRQSLLGSMRTLTGSRNAL